MSRVSSVCIQTLKSGRKICSYRYFGQLSLAMANKDVRERKKESLDYNDLPPLVAQHPEQLEFATDL